MPQANNQEKAVYHIDELRRLLLWAGTAAVNGQRKQLDERLAEAEHHHKMSLNAIEVLWAEHGFKE